MRDWILLQYTAVFKFILSFKLLQANRLGHMATTMITSFPNLHSYHCLQLVHPLLSCAFDQILFNMCIHRTLQIISHQTQSTFFWLIFQTSSQNLLAVSELGILSRTVTELGGLGENGSCRVAFLDLNIIVCSDRSSLSFVVLRLVPCSSGFTNYFHSSQFHDSHLTSQHLL